ncbi:hypothetical protein D3C86_846590 [compost metagenome]
MGRQTSLERTPGVVSMKAVSSGRVASWKTRTLSAATRRARAAAGGRSARASAAAFSVIATRRGAAPSSLMAQSVTA